MIMTAVQKLKMLSTSISISCYISLVDEQTFMSLALQFVTLQEDVTVDNSIDIFVELCDQYLQSVEQKLTQ